MTRRRRRSPTTKPTHRQSTATPPRGRASRSQAAFSSTSRRTKRPALITRGWALRRHDGDCNRHKRPDCAGLAGRGCALVRMSSAGHARHRHYYPIVLATLSFWFKNPKAFRQRSFFKIQVPLPARSTYSCRIRPEVGRVSRSQTHPTRASQTGGRVPPKRRRAIL